jgi:predicted membrane-bound mannosyltransferase
VSRLYLLALAAVTLACAATPTAAQKKEHSHEEQHFNVTPPANVREAWLLIATKVKDAQRLLAEKQTDAVHEIGEQLEAAVHVLKESSTMVTGDKHARLASVLEQLDKVVDDLHHAAEDKDAAQTGLELGKIRTLLPLVEAQYPAGALQ